MYLNNLDIIKFFIERRRVKILKKKICVIVVVLISFFGLSFFNQLKLTSYPSCLNFKVRNGSNVYFGNNEDHALTQISNTVITFVPNGSTWYDGSILKYGAVIVGYGNGSGYSWFQGGMNEKGLAFDSTSVPYTTPNLHNERQPYLVPELFSCENISEVIEYKAVHNVYQQEGRIQSMYADKTGESVVFNIGVDGEFDFFSNNETFQLASNFYFDDPLRGNPSSDAIRRYNAAEEKLTNIVANDNITIEDIVSVLESAHFEGPLVNTLYSNIFDLTNGNIYLYYFHQFHEVVILNLETELAKGWHTYRISDLFTQELIDKAFNEYYDYSVLIRFIPMDLLILVATIILDIVAIITIIFLIVKRIINKFRKSKQLNELEMENGPRKGLRTQTFLSLTIIWSSLSFPMIYWNHNGEWWPFFDDIPILNWPLQYYYGYYNFFLLIGIMGVMLTAFLLFSFTNKGELIVLIKKGLTLGNRKKWKNIVNFCIPVVIGILFLFLEIFIIIPKIDWLMLVILYPLIVIMLVILKPLANMKDNKDQKLTRESSNKNLIKASLKLILIWAICFLPLLLIGILDHMYLLLLLNFSMTLIIASFFEIYFIDKVEKRS